ncbi:uncharacterized protein LOC113288934 isoform X1 [Papaver somniferum]|uniref:uncharacterized protein LOC113288934 isoform X1 n=1 Tax=Papaver somniferum TaxID=3469 RepID=UPI000E6FF6CC|nr:uncharacterized protein LOC113288934 isoform X1 [Papaver somniferum]
MVVMMIQVVDSDLQEKVQNLIEYRSLIKRIAMDNVAWILITWELAARFEMRVWFMNPYTLYFPLQMWSLQKPCYHKYIYEKVASVYKPGRRYLHFFVNDAAFII